MKAENEFELANEKVIIHGSSYLEASQCECTDCSIVPVIGDSSRTVIKEMRLALKEAFITEHRETVNIAYGNKIWSLKITNSQKDVHPDYIVDAIERTINFVIKTTTKKEQSEVKEKVFSKRGKKLANSLLSKVQKSLEGVKDKSSMIVGEGIPEIPSYKSTKSGATNEKFNEGNTYTNEKENKKDKNITPQEASVNEEVEQYNSEDSEEKFTNPDASVQLKALKNIYGGITG